MGDERYGGVEDDFGGFIWEVGRLWVCCLRRDFCGRGGLRGGVLLR